MTSINQPDNQTPLPWWQSTRSRMVMIFCSLFGLVLIMIQLVQLYGLPFKSHTGAINSMTVHEMELLSAIADSRKDLIEHWVRDRRRNARTIAENPAVQSLTPNRSSLAVSAGMSEWLDSIRSDYQLTTVRLLDSSTGTALISFPANGPEPSKQELHLISRSAPIDEQLVVTFDTTSQSSRLHIVIPVKPGGNPDKSPLLFLDVEADLEQFLSSTINQHLASLLGKSGEVVLVDSQKRFLTRTRYPMADGTTPIPLQTASHAKPAELAVAGSEGTIASSDYRNIPVLAAYRHIQLTPEVAWGMIVKKDQQEVYAGLRHEARLYWLFSLLGIITTVIISMFIANRLTSPLRRMVLTAKLIQQGDLTARADETSNSEVAELARSFNSMLDQLQQWHNELDNRVRQRTEQLVSANIELQSEITERTRMEESLHEKTVQLEEEISERQKAQEALVSLNSSLEARIQTTVTELRQKDDLLMHQNRLAAMGEILTNIAHQWRQPLNNIAAYIQTMQYLHKNGELTDEEMDQDIAAVMDIIRYMSQTIDDFRNFFRKDRDQHEFILQEVIDRSLNLLQSSLKACNIKVTVQGDKELRGMGYPNEYAQAVMNILYNARDILVERSVADPEIEINIFREKNSAVVSIQDNGGGIAPEILPHIFDPYFTTKGPSAGTGIGLYMSRTIIERNMEGRITANNSGSGAEFRIELKC
jgi:C4-dicarboxylate-specific signal transduction histidine kinase